VLECLGGSKFNFQERMGEGEGKGGGKEKWKKKDSQCSFMIKKKTQ
jgi:hypothetical protein